MLYRNCAGGVVFSGSKVLLLKNDKGEWVLPKGLVQEGESRREVARERVLREAGVECRFVAMVGETEYEFYSATRKKPVCNQVVWYLMEAKDIHCVPNAREGFGDGGFFDRDDALTRVTYTQDRALLAEAWRRWQELRGEM
ncbi:MAG: NUDIX hydrolase [Clostridiales bacterium]|nr:NUDIX hydrolase [Clostridiales bacterium]